jgi:hypothetical protein
LFSLGSKEVQPLEVYTSISLLYKYCSSERVDVFWGDVVRLRLSPPKALNDDFEGQTRFGGLGDPRRTGLWLEQKQYVPVEFAKQFLDRMPAALRRVLPAETVARVLARIPIIQRFNSHLIREINRLFAKEPGLSTELAELARDIVTRHLEEIGCISFGKTPFSMPMWAHYADRGAGFALGFDPNHPWFHQGGGPGPLRLIRPVVYRDSFPVVHLTDLAAIDPQLRKAPEQYFLRKLSNWRYEREYRILFPLLEADSNASLANGSNIFFKHIPAGALRTVIAGAHATEDLLKGLRSRLDHPTFVHAKLLQLKAKGTRTWLEDIIATS